jgi:hypothetical protein
MSPSFNNAYINTKASYLKTNTPHSTARIRSSKLRCRLRLETELRFARLTSQWASHVFWKFPRLMHRHSWHNFSYLRSSANSQLCVKHNLFGFTGFCQKTFQSHKFLRTHLWINITTFKCKIVFVSPQATKIISEEVCVKLSFELWNERIVHMLLALLANASSFQHPYICSCPSHEHKWVGAAKI